MPLTTRQKAVIGIAALLGIGAGAYILTRKPKAEGELVPTEFEPSVIMLQPDTPPPTDDVPPPITQPPIVTDGYVPYTPPVTTQKVVQALPEIPKWVPVISGAEYYRYQPPQRLPYLEPYVIAKVPPTVPITAQYQQVGIPGVTHFTGDWFLVTKTPPSPSFTGGTFQWISQPEKVPGGRI